MLVLNGGIGCHLALDPARHNHRSLECEIDEGFENADAATHAPPCSVEICIGINADLTFAVIAVARALQDCRAPDIPHGAFEAFSARDLLITRGRHADRGEEILLLQTVL